MELEQLFRELVKAIRASDQSRLHQPHRLRDIQYGLVPYRLVRHSLEVECSEDHEMLLLRLCAGEGGYFKLADADASRAFSVEAEGINPDLGLLQVYGDIEVTLDEQAINRSMTESESESAYRPPDIAPARHQAEADEAEIEEGDRRAEATVIPMPEALPTPPPIPEPTQSDVPPPPPTPEPEPEPENEAFVEAPSPPFELSQDDESPAAEPSATEPGCAYCGGSLPSTRHANYCPHCGQNLNVIRCAQCATELEYGWRHCIACGHSVPEA